MLTFLAVSIVLLLIACGLFSNGSEGPSLLSSSIVMLVLIVGAFWFFGEDSNSGGAMSGRSGSITISRTAW
ncbi:MAG TPA: hypothetical protein VIQ29_17890 [Ancylobacter sp.]